MMNMMERDIGGLTADEQELMTASTQEVILDGLHEGNGRTADVSRNALQKKAELLQKVNDRMGMMIDGVRAETKAQLEEKQEKVENAAEIMAEISSKVTIKRIQDKTIAGLSTLKEAIVDGEKAVDAEGNMDETFMIGTAAHELRHEQKHLHRELNDTVIDQRNELTYRDFSEVDAENAEEKAAPGSTQMIEAGRRRTSQRIRTLYTASQIARIAETADVSPYAMAS